VRADKNSEIRTGDDPADVSSLRPTDHFKNGDTYAVTGSVAVPSIDELRAAGTDYPDWVRETYLQLPSNLPRRVRAKARDVTRSATTPYDMATAIESYLRTFPNDYNVPATPPGRDTVDYFLFDLQRGYFDYHASAMAVMLRTLGIPARVASGYALNPASADADGTYNLTEQDAFTWPEVYFPNIGWVEFSPTPTQPLIQRRGELPPSSAISGGSTQDPSDQQIPDLGITSPAVPTAAAPAATQSESSSTSWLLILGIVAGVAALVAGGLKVAWEWGMGGLSRPAQLWEKTARLATLAGVRPGTHETPREFSARLAGAIDGAEGAGYLAAAYERTRFGQKQLSEDETDRVESAWRSVRSALARRVLRRR
jgi:transglutaminase-like putative cysteine protease